jgi:hypothetical protein
VHGIGDGTQVGVGQQHAGRRLDVRREHHVRLRVADGRDHLRDGRRRVGRLPARLDRARLQHRRLRRDPAHVEDLRPAVAEPPVADDQAIPAGSELPGHRFHPERAAARNDDRRVGAVDLLENAGDVLHHALKGARHVIEGTIGEHHGVFEQTLGVDVGQQAGHGELSRRERGNAFSTA